jgi:hypothetical protein
MAQDVVGTASSSDLFSVEPSNPFARFVPVLNPALPIYEVGAMTQGV